MYKKPSKTKQPDSSEHGYEYALFLLGLRLRTEGEIRFKMTERGYAIAVIDAVIEKLYDYKYIDDARFAEILLENAKLYKNHGYLMIKKKMFEKRLPTAIVEQVLDEHLTVDDETKIAKRFLKKERLDLATYEDRQKAMRKLQARGFRLSSAQKALGD